MDFTPFEDIEGDADIHPRGTGWKNGHIATAREVKHRDDSERDIQPGVNLSRTVVEDIDLVLVQRLAVEMPVNKNTEVGYLILHIPQQWQGREVVAKSPVKTPLIGVDHILHSRRLVDELRKLVTDAYYLGFFLNPSFYLEIHSSQI